MLKYKIKNTLLNLKIIKNQKFKIQNQKSIVYNKKIKKIFYYILIAIYLIIG